MVPGIPVAAKRPLAPRVVGRSHFEPGPSAPKARTFRSSTTHRLRPSVSSSIMKFGELRSIGHNIADSLASGIIGLLVGYDKLDIFGEASRSPDRFIIADFLAGRCSAGTPSPSLARAIALYKDALASLCSRHGTSVSAFRELTTRYSVDSHGRRFVVTVEDRQGHRAADEYVGIPGKRVRVLDHLGRVRRKPRRARHVDPGC